MGTWGLGTCPALARETQGGGRGFGNSAGYTSAATWHGPASHRCQPASPPHLARIPLQGMRMWVTPDRYESCLGEAVTQAESTQAEFLTADG